MKAGLTPLALLLMGLLSSTAARSEALVDGNAFTLGVYGRVEAEPGEWPPVLNRHPWVVRRPAGVRPERLFLYVPLSEVRHWAQHCARYRACSQAVYFVDGARWASRRSSTESPPSALSLNDDSQSPESDLDQH